MAQLGNTIVNGVLRVNGTIYGNVTGSVTGNASTATKLATARTINGVSFDGSSNITVADATKLPLTGGTLTGQLTIDSDTASQLIIDSTGTDAGIYLYRHNADTNVSWNIVNSSGSLYFKKKTVTDTSFTNIVTLSDTDGGQFRYNSISTGATTNAARGVWFNHDSTTGIPVMNISKFTYNPSTDVLKVGTVTANLTGTATKATGDKDGNAIDTTYLKKSGGTMTGDINFSASQSLHWNDGTYRQKVKVTDDSVADTAVFEFQQSTDSGNNYTSLMTIKDNGKVVANNFVGNLTGTATKATGDGNGNTISTTYLKKSETTTISTPIGSIIPFSSTTIPSSYLLCDGSAVSRTTYAALFAVIGTTYGSGDGSTTFNLPDLRGKFVVGQNTGDTDFASLGKRGGEKSHILTINEIPSHSHETWQRSGNQDKYLTDSYGGGATVSTGYQPTLSGATADTQVMVTGKVGGTQAHNNLPPYFTLVYIIKASVTATIKDDSARVIDNLTTQSTGDALSANQGYVLNNTKVGTDGTVKKAIAMTSSEYQLKSGTLDSGTLIVLTDVADTYVTSVTTGMLCSLPLNL